LQIGDGSTATWVADTYKGILHAPNAHFIKVTGNAHFRSGAAVDAAKKTSKGGCSIIDLSTGKNTIEFTSTGIIEIYSSLISTPNSSKLYSNSATGTSHRLWNSTTSKVYTHHTGAFAVFDFYRHNWQSDGAAGPKIVGTIDDVTITDCPNAFAFSFTPANVTISNCKILNETTSFYILFTSVNFYIINTECAWVLSWVNSTGTLYRQYEFDLKVIDKDNSPINAATVKIWDKDSNLVVDTTTNASGVIATQTITRGYYNQANGSTLQEASPHLIKIEKAGYTTYEADFTLGDKIDWLIALQAAGGGLMRNPPLTGGMV
jgi:hypothetical protein